MNQSKRFTSFLTLLFLLAFAASIASAQADPATVLEPSYEVSLQVVVGSNDPDAKPENLPASLSGISRQLKSNFSFTNYRLANTFLGRIANNGNIEYKSVSNVIGQEIDTDAQTFLEWSIGQFRSMPSGFQARTFRFGAKVPIRTATVRDDSGRTSSVLNYESVGLTMSMLGLPLSKPTLVGNISLPKTAGTIFLIATIKPAEM